MRLAAKRARSATRTARLEKVTAEPSLEAGAADMKLGPRGDLNRPLPGPARLPVEESDGTASTPTHPKRLAALRARFARHPRVIATRHRARTQDRRAHEKIVNAAPTPGEGARSPGAMYRAWSRRRAPATRRHT